MLANDRLLDIETKFAAVVQRIVLLEAENETLRVILFLKNGTNLTRIIHSLYFLIFQR